MKELIQKLIHSLSREVWTFLGLTILSFIFIAKFVNLAPQVDQNFFFSSNDPQFVSEEKISELFLRNDAQLILSATGDIFTKDYTNRVKDLTHRISAIDGVVDVTSITNGPRDLKDALASPLWKRLLVSNDQLSTNLVIFLDESKSKQVVLNVEELSQKFQTDSFQIRMSGLPYVVELISRYLLRDLKTFSLMAFIIFGIVIFLIFRSKSVLFGTMISCLNACVWTFMVTYLMGVPIGLLTANLATIIFVLTLSHMIFLTYNWKNICLDGQKVKSAVDKAITFTFEASFWSMLTTLLGFLSLLFVPAKPLRELGIAGAVGSVVAIIVAYCIYPAFLKMTHQPKPSEDVEPPSIIYSFLETNKRYIRMLAMAFCIIALPGLWMMNTDPSMLSFFSKESKIYQGLEYIDQNGGSSPLVVVVKSKNGALMHTGTAYQKLWKLQEALELHRSVGSVVSLPVLLAEAKQEPFAFLLLSDWLLDMLAKPEYGEVAKSFVSKDRQHALFLLRMNELNRVQTRLTIINEIKDIVATHDFVPELTGGVYKLQGHLSKSVAQSLFSGLSKLLLLFMVIAYIVSRSFRISISMIVSLIFIPVGILGAIGMYRVPLDVVSSPASNVAIAIGIDSMIHMIKAYRRKKKANKAKSDNLWKEVRDELWKPVLTSTIIVMTGFSIFLFSTFPPTQRFGGAIVFGTLLAAITALYVMPLCVRRLEKLTK